MRTLLLLTLLCLVLAACDAPAFPAVPPPRAPVGMAIPDLGPQPGICGRTPEVQVSIIREIAVEGPRMSCGSIAPPELYRLRRLPVQSDYLRRGDFLHLVNLRELEVTVGRSALPAGVFAGMPRLRELTLTVVRLEGDDVVGRLDVLTPGVFDGLDSLERLELNGRRSNTGFRLDSRNLRGLEGLRDLDVDSVAHVTPGALRGMRGLRRVRLTGIYLPPTRRDEAPALPPELFASLPGLDDVGVKHFRREQ